MINDPYETRNLAADCPDIAERCRKLMDQWVSEQMKKSNWKGDPLQEVLKERGIRKPGL